MSQLILDVVEGEKCADALKALGFLVTTNQGGSGRAGETDWTPAARFPIVRIWEDVDAADPADGKRPGEEWVKHVCRLIAGAAAVLKTPCPELQAVKLRAAGLVDGQDVYEFIEAELPEGVVDLAALSVEARAAIRATLMAAAARHGQRIDPASINAQAGVGEAGGPQSPEPLGPAPIGDDKRPEITNFKRVKVTEKNDDGEDVVSWKFHALSIDQVRKSVEAGLGGQVCVLQAPGSKEPLLFVPTKKGIQWIPGATALEAFCHERGKVCWNTRQDSSKATYVTWSALYQNFAQSEYVPHYISVEMYPHEPQIKGHCYCCESPADYPHPDGRYIVQLINLFDQISADHFKAIFAAAICTPFWGGRYGERPTISVIADEQGSGKGKLSEAIGALCGGMIESQLNDRAEARLFERLLHPSALHKRVLRFDNVKSVADSELLEALITMPMISGHRLGYGQAERPNNLVVLITANNIRLSPDMARRNFFIHLNKPREMPASWSQRYYALLDAHAQHIAADALAVLRSPLPDVDFAGLGESMGVWGAEVLARVCAYPAFQKVLNGVHVRDVLKANNTLRTECDEDREQAEMFEDGFIQRVADEHEWMKTKPSTVNGNVVRWIEMTVDGNLRTYMDKVDVPKIIAQIPPLFYSTDELCDHWLKIFKRKEVNSRWLGRTLSGHVKAGRIKWMSPGKDETQTKRGYVLSPEAFKDYFELFLRLNDKTTSDVDRQQMMS